MLTLCCSPPTVWPTLSLTLSVAVALQYGRLVWWGGWRREQPERLKGRILLLLVGLVGLIPFIVLHVLVSICVVHFIPFDAVAPLPAISPVELCLSD